MEIVIDWIQIAYLLSEKHGMKTTDIEKALRSHEKLKKKLLDAREYMEKLSEKEDISDEELDLAQSFLVDVLNKLSDTQKRLFVCTIDTCISSLKKLCVYSKSSDCSEDEIKEFEQISSTVCDKIKESDIRTPQFLEMKKLAKKLKSLN